MSVKKILSYFNPYAEQDEGEDESEIITRKPLPVLNRPDATVELPGELNRSKVVNIHATAQLSVVLVKPERFDTVSDIADNLRDKRTVVLNLENTPKDIARRLLDFLSGAAYANGGKLMKVANAIYIITPFNVEIMGDIMDELENKGLIF